MHPSQPLSFYIGLALYILWLLGLFVLPVAGIYLLRKGPPRWRPAVVAALVVGIAVYATFFHK
jgi:hypothetical protein